MPQNNRCQKWVCLVVGGYISSESVKKIREINGYLLGTMAGRAADQIWQNLQIACSRLKFAGKGKITAGGASRLLLAEILKNCPSDVEAMIGGWDAKGPALYYMNNKSMPVDGDRFCVGSGSPYAYSILDDGYRKDMTVMEAAELARCAINHATLRDGASGGAVAVYHVGPNGWNKLPVEPAKAE